MDSNRVFLILVLTILGPFLRLWHVNLDLLVLRAQNVLPSWTSITIEIHHAVDVSQNQRDAKTTLLLWVRTFVYRGMHRKLS